ncbi:hypothetical protein ACFQU2_18500 [Siccirubricoccus deserti]
MGYLGNGQPVGGQQDNPGTLSLFLGRLQSAMIVANRVRSPASMMVQTF